MTRDFSRLTDQELLSIVGQQPQQTSGLQNIASKVFNITQQLASGEPLRQVGEAALNIPVGLGRTAVGAVQAGAQLTGQDEFAQRLGQQVRKEREAEGEISGAAKVGRAIGETIIPALVSPARLVTGGLVGGAAIGATAPQEEGGLRERGIETAKGAAIGGLAGGVLKAGAVAVRGIRGLRTVKQPEDILARRLPTEQTTKLLEQLKTATPDSPVILPDIAGDEIKGLTRAVGKLSGGKDVVVDAIEGRSLKAVERVSNQLSRDISDVDTYFGSLDDIAKARSELAAPLYKKAFDRGTTLDVKDNKALFDKIKPDLAEARKKFRIPKVTDKVQKGITIAEKNELIKKASGNSDLQEDQLFSIADRFKEATKEVKDFKPKSLFQFIKEGGGVLNSKGELASIGITNRTLPGLLRTKDTGGIDLDDVGLRLLEGGYFNERPTTSQVLNLIDREARGNKVFLPSRNQSIFDEASLFLDGIDRNSIDIPSIELLRKSTVRSFTEGIADNSLVMLDNAKKILDDKISVAIRGGERQQARSLQGIKNELVTKLDQLNPDYKKARQVFSDFSSIHRAQEQGLQFSKLRPEELQRLFKTLSVSEKEAFRIGARENLQKTVSTTAEGADPAKRIFGNSFKRNQIKAIFPNETKFRAFETRMKEEIAAAETKFKVLGGSRTDINIAGDAEFIDTVSKVGGGLALGSTFAVTHALVSSFKRIFGGISTKSARDLANILVKREKSIEALENILVKEKNAVQRRVLTEAIQTIKPNLAAAQAAQQTQQ